VKWAETRVINKGHKIDIIFVDGVMFLPRAQFIDGGNGSSNQYCENLINSRVFPCQ